MVINGLGSKPSSYESRLANVRTNSSAPTSETNASATCTTTSELLSSDRRTLLPRVPSFNVSTRLPREVCSAGNKPKNTAVATATIAAYASERQSTSQVM